MFVVHVLVLQRDLAVDPNSLVAHDGLWDVFFLKHRYAEALHEARASLVLLGRKDVSDALARGYEKGRYAGAMEEGANALVTARSPAYVGAISIARFHAHAMQNGRALEWLEKGVSERDTRMCYVVGDPVYATIRRDPRFPGLLQRAHELARMR